MRGSTRRDSIQTQNVEKSLAQSIISQIILVSKIPKILMLNLGGVKKCLKG